MTTKAEIALRREGVILLSAMAETLMRPALLLPGIAEYVLFTPN
jgi:hypothetical protein